MIKKEHFFHHVERFSTKRNFHNHVQSLVDTINDYGNLFLDQYQDLLTLDTNDIMDQSVVGLSKELKTWGESSSTATFNLCLLIVHILFMNLLRKTTCVYSSTQNLSPRQNIQKQLKA